MYNYQNHHQLQQQHHLHHQLHQQPQPPAAQSSQQHQQQSLHNHLHHNNHHHNHQQQLHHQTPGQNQQHRAIHHSSIDSQQQQLVDEQRLISNLYDCTNTGFEQAIRNALDFEQHQHLQTNASSNISAAVAAAANSALGTSYNNKSQQQNASNASHLDADSLACLLSSTSILQQQSIAPSHTPTSNNIYNYQNNNQLHQHHQQHLHQQPQPPAQSTQQNLHNHQLHHQVPGSNQRALHPSIDNHQLVDEQRLISNLYDCTNSGFEQAIRSALDFKQHHHHSTAQSNVGAELAAAAAVAANTALGNSYNNKPHQHNSSNAPHLDADSLACLLSSTSILQQQPLATATASEQHPPTKPSPIQNPISNKPTKPESYSSIVAKSTGFTNNTFVSPVNNNVSSSSANSNLTFATKISTNNISHNSINNNVTANHKINVNGGNHASTLVGHSNSPILGHQSSLLALDPANYASHHSSLAQPHQSQHQLFQQPINHSNFHQLHEAIQQQPQQQQQSQLHLTQQPQLPSQTASQHQQSQTNSSSNTTPSDGSATNLLGFMGLYVGNLSPDLTKEQLEKIFSKYGEPVKAHRLLRSPVAFIKYENTESPRAAIEDLHGVLLPEMTLNRDQPLKLHFDRNDTQLKANYRPTELPPKADNGECYGWRTTVCRKGKHCTKKHIPINRGIDFQMWMIKTTTTGSS